MEDSGRLYKYILSKIKARLFVTLKNNKTIKLHFIFFFIFFKYMILFFNNLSRMKRRTYLLKLSFVRVFFCTSI